MVVARVGAAEHVGGDDVVSAVVVFGYRCLAVNGWARWAWARCRIIGLDRREAECGHVEVLLGFRSEPIRHIPLAKLRIAGHREMPRSEVRQRTLVSASACSPSSRSDVRRDSRPPGLGLQAERKLISPLAARLLSRGRCGARGSRAVGVSRRLARRALVRRQWSRFPLGPAFRSHSLEGGPLGLNLGGSSSDLVRRDFPRRQRRSY